MVALVVVSPAAVAEAPHGAVRLHDGGLGVSFASDRLRVFGVEWEAEFGRTFRFGGVFSIGAEWPSLTPAGAQSGGPSFSLGPLAAIHLSPLVSVVVDTRLRGTLIYCGNDACRANPATEHGYGASSWVSRAGVRLSLGAPSRKYLDSTIDLFVGACAVKKLGGDGNLPDGFGPSFAVGVGARD